jgi:pyruvate dehydrogenase E2 component (dihydrolipoamide acetyltransferase)
MARGIDPLAFQSVKKERITESDVQRYLNDLPLAPRSSPVPAEAEKVELTGIRKRIADRMSLSKKTIPHFYLRVAVDATAMIRMHQSLPFKPSYNDMLIKACAMAMVEFPDVNVSIVENTISKHHNCNIGLAVSLGKGLIVPVVHAAEAKSLEAIGALTADLVARGRAGKLTLDEVTGGAFTVTSLGVHPIEEFSAIINPPESAILAVGRILSQPVVVGQQVVPGNVVKLTLSVDHRIIDGMLAAEFLSRIKGLLEAGDPLTN